MENKITTPEKEKKESFWDLIKFALLAIIIVIPIRVFIAQPFVVSGQSMYPTFSNGDYLIVDELSYNIGKPNRNEVVIFRYPEDPKKFFIKRIIGLPNETIQIKNNEIVIFNKENPEGFTLKQPEIKEPTTKDTYMKLNSSEYFVLGDNRTASSDSRYWGALPEKLIVGTPIFRLYPINKISFKPGSF